MKSFSQFIREDQDDSLIPIEVIDNRQQRAGLDDIGGEGNWYVSYKDPEYPDDTMLIGFRTKREAKSMFKQLKKFGKI